MYKVAIIGGGVVGGLIARKMAEYDVKTVILEKDRHSHESGYADFYLPNSLFFR